MSKLLVLSLLGIVALQGSDRFTSSLGFDSIPNDMQVLISSCIIKESPTNQFGLLEAGASLNKLGMASKKFNQLIHSDATTVYFSGIASKHADVSFLFALGLLNTKGARALLKQKKQFLNDEAIDCKDKIGNVVSLIAAIEQSCRFALFSQTEKQRIVSLGCVQKLNSLYEETHSVRSQLDEMFSPRKDNRILGYFQSGRCLHVNDNMYFLCLYGVGQIRSNFLSICKMYREKPEQDFRLSWIDIQNESGEWIDSSLLIKDKENVYVALLGRYTLTFFSLDEDRNRFSPINTYPMYPNMCLFNYDWHKNICVLQFLDFSLKNLRNKLIKYEFDRGKKQFTHFGGADYKPLSDKPDLEGIKYMMIEPGQIRIGDGAGTVNLTIGIGKPNDFLS